MLDLVAREVCPKSTEAWRRSTSSIPGLASAGRAMASRKTGAYTSLATSVATNEDRASLSRTCRAAASVEIRRRGQRALELTCPCKGGMRCCRRKKTRETAGQRRLQRVGPDAWYWIGPLGGVST